MNAERLELAPLLARRELWLLLSTAFVDPYHRERFAGLRDTERRHRALQAARLLAQEAPAIELGPGEVQPGELAPGRPFNALEEDWATILAARKPRTVISVQPELSVEPLATVYQRRLESYRFVRQVIEGAFGAVFLHKAQHNREEYDNGDGYGLNAMAEKGGKSRCGEENDDQNVPELFGKKLPRRDATSRRQLVGAVAVQARPGLFLREAAR